MSQSSSETPENPPADDPNHTHHEPDHQKTLHQKANRWLQTQKTDPEWIAKLERERNAQERKKRRLCKIISDLMTIPMPPPINPCHPLDHHLQATISAYECLGDAEQMFLDNVARNPSSLDVAIKFRALREIGHRMIEFRRHYKGKNIDQNDAMLLSAPTNVDFMTNTFSHLFKDAMDSAVSGLKSITYDQQRGYDENDPTNGEKNTGFLEFKQQLLANLQQMELEKNKLFSAFEQIYTAEEKQLKR
jgi:hypothetical protein